IRAWIVRVLIARPLPEHTGQGSSTTSPRPRQVRHGSEKAKLPRVFLARRGRGGGVGRWAPNPPRSRSPSRPPVPVFVPVPDPPNRSPRSKPPNPPWAPPPAGDRKPPPKRERASSYSLRRFPSDSTECASEISLKRSSDDALPLFASGWYLRASLRYAFLISSGVAVLETPRTL